MKRQLIILAVIIIALAVPAQAATVVTDLVEDDATWTNSGGMWRTGLFLGINPQAGSDWWTGNPDDTLSKTFTGTTLAAGTYTIVFDIGNLGNNSAFPTVKPALTAGGTSLIAYQYSSHFLLPAVETWQEWTLVYTIAADNPHIGEDIGFSVSISGADTSAYATFDDLTVDHSEEINTEPQWNMSYNPGVLWHVGGPSTDSSGWAGQTVTRSQINYELQLMKDDGYSHVMLNGNWPYGLNYGNETWNRFEYALDWCDDNGMDAVLELNYQYSTTDDKYNDAVGSVSPTMQIWVDMAKYHSSLIGVTLGNEVGPDIPSPGDEPDLPDYLAGFRDYLLERHGTLEALNTAWGSSYTDINEVNFPAKADVGYDDDPGYDDLYRFGLIQFGRYYSEIFDYYYKSDPALGPNLIYGSEGAWKKDAYGDYPAATVAVYDDLMAYFPAWYIKAASETTSKPSFNTEIHLYNDGYSYGGSIEITRFRYFTDPLQGEWMNTSYAWGQWNSEISVPIHAETPGVLADVKRLEPQLRLFNTESRQSRLGVLMMRELLYMNYYKQPDYDPDPMTRAYSVMAATGRPWRFVKDLDLPDGQLDDLLLWSSDEMPISTLDAIVALPPSVSVHLVGALPTKTEYGLSLPPAKITELSNRIDSTYSTDDDALNAFVDPELPSYCHNIVDIVRLYWNPAPLGHFWYYLPYPEIEARKAVDANDTMVVVLINHSENPVTLPAGPSLPWYDTATMSSAVDITDDTPVTVDFGSSIVLDEFDVHVYQYIQPVKAWDPSPVDSAGGVSGDVVLSWKAGRYADSHDVFFGGTFNDVNDATADFLTGDVDQSSCVDMNDLSVMADQWLTDGSSVPSANLNGDSIVNFEDFAKMAEYWLQCGVYYGNQTETTYDPDGTLEPGTYYWRIDEVNEPDVWKGDIWQFTVPAP